MTRSPMSTASSRPRMDGSAAVSPDRAGARFAGGATGTPTIGGARGADATGPGVDGVDVRGGSDGSGGGVDTGGAEREGALSAGVSLGAGDTVRGLVRGGVARAIAVGVSFRRGGGALAVRGDV